MTQYHNCYVNIDETDLQLLQTAVNQKSISGKGPFVETFEKSLGAYFGSPYALCCSNGTAAIHMVLLHEGIGAGDEVLLPPTAPVMSVLPILAVGATPVFVDTEAGNFNVDLADLQRKISPSTRMLINVPMWGYANNVDETAAVCRRAGIKVLEDNSHCHGTTLHNQYLGTFGDYSVFSTHERKLITTGEGGFILIKDKADYEGLLQVRSFGEVATSEERFRNVKGAYGYFFGLNFKLSSINAALGIAQLGKLAAKLQVRRENGQYLAARVAERDPAIREMATRAGSVSNYYSIVLLTEPQRRARIERKLQENNIISDPMRYKYQPLYRMPLFEQYASHCPNAEVLIQSVFTLPVHEGLTTGDLDLFLELIEDVQYA